jgi:hypothetical protein
VPLTRSERKLRASIAANARWARGGRAEHGAKIRAAKIAHYEAQVDPDGRLDPAERARRAQNALTADMQRLALRSARARKKAS